MIATTGGAGVGGERVCGSGTGGGDFGAGYTGVEGGLTVEDAWSWLNFKPSVWKGSSMSKRTYPAGYLPEHSHQPS